MAKKSQRSDNRIGIVRRQKTQSTSHEKGKPSPRNSGPAFLPPSKKQSPVETTSLHIIEEGQFIFGGTIVSKRLLPIIGAEIRAREVLRRAGIPTDPPIIFTGPPPTRYRSRTRNFFEEMAAGLVLNMGFQLRRCFTEGKIDEAVALAYSMGQNEMYSRIQYGSMRGRATTAGKRRGNQIQTERASERKEVREAGAKITRRLSKRSKAAHLHSMFPHLSVETIRKLI
jgi:hypothetical protein